VWRRSTAAQRKGYFAAGQGFQTGRFLDKHAEQLSRLLLQAEIAIEDADETTAISAICGLAKIIFSVPPFVPREPPEHWLDMLSEWLRGTPLAMIVARDPARGVQFVDEAIVYQLVWGMEAIRVRSIAHRDEYADYWTGRATAAVETGALNPAATVLLQAGLGSRVAALAALESCPDRFTNFAGMRDWLQSETVADLTKSGYWPSRETAQLWQEFVRSSDSDRNQTWERIEKTCRVRWQVDVSIPAVGEAVRLLPEANTGTVWVCTPEFDRLGRLITPTPRDSRKSMYGTVAGGQTSVRVIYVGPKKVS
jgi:hypothetical protein